MKVTNKDLIYHNIILKRFHPYLYQSTKMALSLPDSKLAGTIHSAGGNNTKVIEVTDAGADISPADTAHSLGYIKESVFSDKTPSEIQYAEDKLPATTEDGNREIKTSGIMMQSGSANLLFATQARGKNYRGYKYNGKVKYGATEYHQEIFWANSTVTPDMELKFPGGEIPFELTILNNPSVITFAASAFGAYCGQGSLSATTISVSANVGWTVVETPVS